MLNLGDLVIVITNLPGGLTDTETYGNVGLISNIDHLGSGNTCYQLHALWSEYDFWYEEDELRLMTDEEARLCLSAVIAAGGSK